MVLDVFDPLRMVFNVLDRGKSLLLPLLSTKKSFRALIGVILKCPSFLKEGNIYIYILLFMTKLHIVLW